MSIVYNDFRYILQNSNLSELDEINFKKIYLNNGDEIGLQDSLRNLSYFLHRYYDKNVIILIDEYDAPVIAALKNGYYDQCINFMHQFLGCALKTNPYLDFAILTGITRIQHLSIFRGLNNFKTFSVFSDTYSDVFGFTEKEVIQIMNDFNISDKLDEISDLYNGYMFGNSEIYNPWTVLNYFFAGCLPKSYWISTSENIIIKDLLEKNDPEIIDDLKVLMRCDCIARNIDDDLVYAGIDNNIHFMPY